MAPFPESESMTIKRLEVALRKEDMTLLKDGAYKLHEKFHTGHRFEFANELKQILEYVNTHDIPQEVKEILCPTIEEILEAQNGIINSFAKTLPQEETGSIENYAFGKTFEVIEEEPKTQFENIGTVGLYEPKASFEEQKPIETKQPVAVEPAAQEVALPPVLAKTETVVAQPIIAPVAIEPPAVKQTEPAVEKIETTQAQNAVVETSKFEPVSAITPKEEAPKEPIEIAVFYDDGSTDTNPNEIKNYRNKLNELLLVGNSAYEKNIIKDVVGVLTIANRSTLNFDKFAGAISNSKNHISILTTTQSENFVRILNEKEVDFEIPYAKEAENKENSCTLIPLSGLSNIFICSNCNSRFFKKDLNNKAISIQCPRCEGVSFPDLYALNSYNADCNPIWWHRGLSALSKAKVWVLINPPLDENKEIIFDYIKAAAQCSKVERIYILSKETEKKEIYRQMLVKTLGDKIDLRTGYYTQEQFVEDYIKTEITDKTFAQ